MTIPRAGTVPPAPSDGAPPPNGAMRSDPRGSVSHRGLGPVRRGIRETGLALITLGVVILLFVAYQLYGTNLTEEHHQSALAKTFHAEIAAHTTPTTTPGTVNVPTPGTVKSSPTATALPSAPAGGAIDHLEIPKIGVDKYVVEGTNEDDLREGPGHYTGTAYPGQIGNAGIAGHRTTYGAPFFELNNLTTGDSIYITDLDNRTWLYRVSQAPEVVSPYDTAVLDPTTFAQLTLTTCNPRFSATSRLVVVARLVGRALPASPVKAVAPTVSVLPGDTPTSLTPTSVNQTSLNLGSGDSKAWPPTIVFGLLALLGWIGVRIWINRSRRWYRAAAYLVGIGLCLIPLWFLFENAVLLLPQSI